MPRELDKHMSMRGAGILSAAMEDELPPPLAHLPPLPPLIACAQRRGSAYEDAVGRLSGPTPCTNWIIPGRLLCGEKPHGALAPLTRAGVTTFVSLLSKGDLPSYRDGAISCNPAAMFVALPIPDQRTTTDFEVAALVLRLVRRLACGECIYIHCRGGHGRTGTLVSLLLGLCYGLDGPTSLATYQCLHDLRQRPVFASNAGYEPGTDGGCCVALFPEQRQQVLRLLAASPLTVNVAGDVPCHVHVTCTSD